jgi:CBS domain-containing protein
MNRDLADVVRNQKPFCLQPNATLKEACEAMTREPDAMPPGLKAIDALRLMHDGGFRHVPIAEHGRPIGVGIASRGDFRGLEHDRLDAETGLWERIA